VKPPPCNLFTYNSSFGVDRFTGVGGGAATVPPKLLIGENPGKIT